MSPFILLVLASCLILPDFTMPASAEVVPVYYATEDPLSRSADNIGVYQQCAPCRRCDCSCLLPTDTSP